MLKKTFLSQAARCIYGAEPEWFLIEYATTIISHGTNGPNVAQIEELIWHERFEILSDNDDIGLVKVETPLTIDLFGFKVRLPVRNDFFPTGTLGVLAGWGLLDSESMISTVLQKVTLQV